MAQVQDATIVLHDLECISEGGLVDPFGQGEPPYIWPALVWLDTIELGGTSLFLGESQLILKTNMRAGDTADIPYPLGTLSHRFESVTPATRLLLVVLVWVRRHTPGHAVWAGCQAFTSALAPAIQSNLAAFLDPTSSQEALDNIKQNVATHIRSAIEDSLSWQEALLLASDPFARDVIIGSDLFMSADLTPADFTLSMSDDLGNSYAVHGGLRVTTPAVDVCQTAVDEVATKQNTVDDITGHISDLTARMAQAAPAEKPYIAQQISQASGDLAVAEQNLTDARAALKECRDHWTRVVGSIPRPPGTPISIAPEAPPGG